MSKNKKFLIFTVFIDNHNITDPNVDSSKYTYPKLAEITMPSYQEYCKIHGYDFLIVDKNPYPNKWISWIKFGIFLENMDKYTHIFYVECDSMLMNQTIRLENLIDDTYEIIVSKTPRKEFIELNTGPILVKSSERNKNFFKFLFEHEEYVQYEGKEQQMLTDIINNPANDFIKDKVKIVDLRYFNSLYHQWYKEGDGNFKIGDFICHAPGCPNNYRFKLFNELKNYIIKIPDIKIQTEPFI